RGLGGATPAAAAASGGSTMTIQPGGAVFVSGKLPEFDTYTVTLPVAQSRVTAIRLETLSDGALAGNDIARAGYTFILSEFEAAAQKGDGPAQPVKLAMADVDQDDEGFPAIAMLDGRPD